MNFNDYFNMIKLKIYKLHKKHKYLFYSFFLFIFLISVCFNIYKFNFKYFSDKNSKKIYVKVVYIQSVSESKISYLVKINNNTKYSDSFILNIYKDEYFNKNVDLNEYINFEYGDILVLSGKISIPKLLNNPYEFDYKKYLNSKNIYGTISTYSVKKVDNKADNVILKSIYTLKTDLNNKIDEKIPESEANLLKSMVYGDDTYLDENIKKDFKNIGISHLIAVSGSNISLILLLIYYLADKFSLKKITKNILAIFCILFFCIFANSELSLVRASIMCILAIAFKMMNKRADKYKIIFISLYIILVNNSYVIFNVGFTLSYTAVLGIAIGYKTIFSFFDVKLKNTFHINYLYKLENKFKAFVIKNIYLILKYILLLFCMTISCQLFTLPIQIYYFNFFTFSSFLSNILVAIVSSIQEVLSLFSIILINVPFVSDILINANFIFLRLIILIARKISSLNLLSFNIASSSIICIFCYYFLYILIYINFKLNRKLKNYSININLKFLKIKRKGRRIKGLKITKNKLKSIIYFLFLFNTSYIVIWYIYTGVFENYIYYFNVGQGNMAFIRYNRKNIIVDCGSTDKNVAGNIMTTFLKAKAITNVEGIFVTHMHSDHVNGFEKISSNVKVKKVCYSIPKFDNVSEYDNFEKVIEKNEISSCQIQIFDQINFETNMQVEVLSPPNDSVINSSDGMNANSNVYLFSINNKNYLFTGDADKETEEFIIQKLKETNNSNIALKLQNISVLQVCHHGSKTSSSEDFLKYINAKQGIISAKKEKYGHPADITIQNLNKYNIKIRITENEGAIKIKL